MRENSSGTKGTIQSLQILRFFAALIVILDHCQFVGSAIAERAGVTFTFPSFHGRLGVDIFFVISGFIMVYISSGRDEWSTPPGVFVIDRVSRIVPIYYLATAIWIALFLGARYVNSRHFEAPWPPREYVLSALFIPYLDPATALPQPVLPQGWTLDYEMFFYMLFAAALIFRRARGMLFLFLVFGGLAIAGQIWNAAAGDTFVLTPLRAAPGAQYFTVPRFWLHPIILEFLAGTGLALLRERLLAAGLVPRFRYTVVVLIALIAAYTAAYNTAFFSAPALDALRSLIAISSVSICVLTLDTAPKSAARDLSVECGNASYSLYLCHVHILFIMTSIWKRVGVGSVGVGGFVAVSIVACLMASLLVHRTVEKPLSQHVRRMMRGRMPPRVAVTVQ
jgi:exopolysaccharide production protein ExoZ